MGWGGKRVLGEVREGRERRGSGEAGNEMEEKSTLRGRGSHGRQGRGWGSSQGCGKPEEDFG